MASHIHHSLIPDVEVTKTNKGVAKIMEPNQFFSELHVLIDTAIEQFHFEDQLHPVIEHILGSFRQVLSTESRSMAVSCSLQVRTVDQELFRDFKNIRSFLTRIPDGGFLLHTRDDSLDITKRVAALLTFELKLLEVDDNNFREYQLFSNRFLAWEPHHLNYRLVMSRLRNSIPQLLLQGFISLHRYRDQNTIYIVFLVGIYMTVLEFTRPVCLHSLPRKLGDTASTSSSEPIDVSNKHIAQNLVPFDNKPKVLLAAEPITERDADGSLTRLSVAFRHVLKLGLEQGKGLVKVEERSLTSVFKLTSNEKFILTRSGEKGKQQAEGILEKWYEDTLENEAYGDASSGGSSEASLSKDSSYMFPSKKPFDSVLKLSPARTRMAVQMEAKRYELRGPFAPTRAAAETEVVQEEEEELSLLPWIDHYEPESPTPARRR